MRRRSFLGLAALSALLTGSPPAGASVAGGQFEFALLGDLFSREQGVEEVSQLLTSIAATHARFILDVGSLKSDEERCSDELLAQRFDMFNASLLPLVPVAAENEWLGCAQGKQGSFDPGERLDAIRAELFATPTSMGSQPLSLARESAMRQFRSYAENTRFEIERILFVTLNVPSPNNDYRFAGGRNGEFEDRVIANRAWLERSFRYAETMHLPGIVIAIEADPEFARPLRAPDHRLLRRDGYYELKTMLREETLRFHGQVLLVHCSAAGYLIDQPLQDGAGHAIRNFTRVRTLPASDSGSWLQVTADAHAPRVFSVKQRALETAGAASSTR